MFLAREFDVHVIAADLWTPVDDNWKRIVEAKVAHRVMPMHLEAHALPFAASYFDAIVSVDAFAYFAKVRRVRHTFCSHLAMRGAPARTIKELAGHRSMAATMRYMHLSPGATDAVIRLLDEELETRLETHGGVVGKRGVPKGS